ncbi:MAG TPA: hypothetical protein VFS60_11535 [Thermoanaerobaculia bacterium]|nr:hypothetical protein [Thermoanaerobaculia bacterium]
MRHQLATVSAGLLLLWNVSSASLADDASDHATVRAEPVPGGPVSPENAVSAHFVSEDGEGKVVGLAAVDFGIGKGKEKEWTLGFEVSSPFDEKADDEAELISIESLGPGSTARLFLTFDHFSSQPNAEADGKSVCDEIGRRALALEIERRAVQKTPEQRGSKCPADMVTGEWYRLDNPGGPPRACDFDLLRCIGGDTFEPRANAAVEGVCLEANKLLLGDFFHARQFIRDLDKTPYAAACPDSVEALAEALVDRVTRGQATEKAIAADGPWGTAGEKAGKWVTDQLQEAVAPICNEYRTLDLGSFWPGGGNDECILAHAEAFLTEREQSDASWADLRSQVRDLISFNEWLLTVSYETAKSTSKHFDLATSQEIEQDERPYNLSVSFGLFTGRTLYGAEVSQIRRFAPARKQQVCVPATTPATATLRCFSTATDPSGKQEYVAASVRARRFLGRRERYAGVAELKYSAEDDALEPHLILYALQHTVKGKVDGLNGGLDVGYNTETDEPIFRVFIGSTFALGPD